MTVAAGRAQTQVRAAIMLENDLSQAVKFYRAGDHTAALHMLVHGAANHPEHPAYTLLVRGAEYSMYKAYVMSNKDRSRDPQLVLPMNFLVLERKLANGRNAMHKRAVWAVSHFGTIGLRIHDWLERHGR